MSKWIPIEKLKHKQRSWYVKIESALDCSRVIKFVKNNPKEIYFQSFYEMNGKFYAYLCSENFETGEILKKNKINPYASSRAYKSYSKCPAYVPFPGSTFIDSKECYRHLKNVDKIRRLLNIKLV